MKRLQKAFGLALTGAVIWSVSSSAQAEVYDSPYLGNSPPQAPTWGAAPPAPPPPGAMAAPMAPPPPQMIPPPPGYASPASQPAYRMPPPGAYPPPQAQAQFRPAPQPRPMPAPVPVAPEREYEEQPPSYLAGGFGIFDVSELNGWPYDIITGNENLAAFEFRLEYRMEEVLWGAGPFVGGMITTDRALYGYGGVYWDLPVSDNFSVVPNFAVGAFDKGNGKDLGGVLEFRSGIEIDYNLPSGAKVGLAYSHMSNAGTYDRNPGQESLMFIYAEPFSLSDL